MPVTVPKNLRYLDPSLYDRVVHLLETNTIDELEMKRCIDNWVWSMVIKPDISEFGDIMKKLETYLTEKSIYTFVLSVPLNGKSYRAGGDL